MEEGLLFVSFLMLSDITVAFSLLSFCVSLYLYYSLSIYLSPRPLSVSPLIYLSVTPTLHEAIPNIYKIHTCATERLHSNIVPAQVDKNAR